MKLRTHPAPADARWQPVENPYLPVFAHQTSPILVRPKMLFIASVRALRNMIEKDPSASRNVPPPTLQKFLKT